MICAFEIQMIARKEREILSGHSGKVLWLIGLSGAGKSTFAKMLEKLT